MLLFLEILGVAQFSHRPTSPHLPLQQIGVILIKSNFHEIRVIGLP